MPDYIISCCSMVDLTDDYMKEIGVPYLGGNFTVGDRQYVDDMGKSLSAKELYTAMRNDVPVGTSQNNTHEFREFFENLLKTGKDVLHISFSSGASNTFRTATQVRDELVKEYPNQKFYVVDSLSLSTGYGFLVDEAVRLRNEGMGIDELYAWIKEHRTRLHHLFFSHDLTFYVKGGRISKTSGAVGSLLGICPLLYINKEGKLIPMAKIRSKKRVMQELMNKMEEYIPEGVNYSGKCFVNHSDSYEEATTIAQMAKERFKNIKGDIKIFDIGTVIGCHSGPGTVAIFFWGNERN